MDLANSIVDVEKRLRADRETEMTLWEEVYTYILPRKSFYEREVTDLLRRRTDILDSTAARSLEQFASFLYTTLNNPTTRWVVASARNAPPEVKASAEYQQAMEAIGRELQEWLTAGQSNLYNALHEAYFDFGTIGNAVLHPYLVGEQFRCEAVHLEKAVFDEDAYGLPAAVFTKHCWTVQQQVQRFGEIALTRKNEASVSEEQAQKRVLEDKTEDVIEAVFPADPGQYGLARALPDDMLGDGDFVSVWVRKDDKKVLRDPVMQRSQTYAVGRWNRQRGSRYGRGPGVVALPDIRMANRMASTMLSAAEKLTDPPLKVRDGSVIGPLRLHPGGVTHYDGDIGPEPLLPPGASRIDVGEVQLDRVISAIREAFFTPLFLDPQASVRTATEILQLTDERNRAVGPMLSRIQYELFTPLIRRALDLADQIGVLSPLPSQYIDLDLVIEYRSPLSASQAQIEALGAQRLLEGLAGWAQVSPQVFDRFDPDKIADVLHRGSGAPSEVLRSRSDMQRIREARAAAQQQEQQLDAAERVGIPAAQVAVNAARGGQR